MANNERNGKRVSTIKNKTTEVVNSTGIPQIIKTQISKSLTKYISASLFISEYHARDNNILKYLFSISDRNFSNNEYINIIPRQSGIYRTIPEVNEPIIFNIPHQQTICSLTIINGVEGTGNKYYKITFIGRHSRKYINNVLRMIKTKINRDNVSSREFKDVYNLRYMTPSNGNSYIIKCTSFNNVILNDKEEFIGKIDKFLTNKAMYNKYSIPYKLGILLYGQPGTGKTSLVKAIIHHHQEMFIGTDVYTSVIQLSLNEETFKVSLSEIITMTTSNLYNTGCYYIIVIEEIDTIFATSRDNMRSPTALNNINLLLQFLDGASTPSNCTIIATTNFIDKLDPALIRDGRFDIKVELTNMDKSNAKLLCDKFGVDYSILDDETFPINPAYLQNKIFNSEFEL